MIRTKILWMSSGVRWGSTCQKILTGMHTSEDLTTLHTAKFYRGSRYREPRFLCRKIRDCSRVTSPTPNSKAKKEGCENCSPLCDNIISSFALPLRGDCPHYIP